MVSIFNDIHPFANDCKVLMNDISLIPLAIQLDVADMLSGFQ